MMAGPPKVDEQAVGNSGYLSASDAEQVVREQKYFLEEVMSDYQGLVARADEVNGMMA